MADETKLSPGDVVRLKSGGPPMTISKTIDGYSGPKAEVLVCLWFVDGKLEEARIPTNALVLV